ncbi:hypothetical protein EI555_014758, partial [Monodon monoceros]
REKTRKLMQRVFWTYFNHTRIKQRTKGNKAVAITTMLKGKKQNQQGQPRPLQPPSPEGKRPQTGWGAHCSSQRPSRTKGTHDCTKCLLTQGWTPGYGRQIPPPSLPTVPKRATVDMKTSVPSATQASVDLCETVCFQCQSA